MLGRLAKLLRHRPRRRRLSARDMQAWAARIIRGAYDAAQTTGENRRHWANADYLSPSAAGTFGVRRLIRSRCRYEVANNSIARGIVLTLANDLVGTGPRLQLQTDNSELNRRVEDYFAQWAGAVGLATKLRTMRMARAQDGETFGVFFTNPGLQSPAKLDLRLIEADRVTTPTASLATDEAKAIDGITFDEHGNPVEYHVLRSHPGASAASLNAFEEYDRLPAANVVHWFRQDRPEQRRGLPDIMPALPLFALLRRFTLATLAAAETAAQFSVIMQTTAPAGGEAAEVEPHVTMELDRNIGLFLPEGWTAQQLRAEHPAETFEPFRRAVIGEIARCLNVPLNIALCDSSQYNYASGRLDHQTYFKSIGVERADLEAVVLDRIFRAWMAEVLYVSDYALFGEIERIFWPRQWMWPGREHVDPLKEASAQAKRLESGTTTLAIEYANAGRDWEAMTRQRAKEYALIRDLKLPPPGRPKQGARQ